MCVLVWLVHGGYSIGILNKLISKKLIFKFTEDAELPPMDGAGEILSSESAPREKLRPKLLSFHENRRPPYWGTWRKKSVSIKPRKPFGQDEVHKSYLYMLTHNNLFCEGQRKSCLINPYFHMNNMKFISNSV